jgi:hypothetical protein
MQPITLQVAALTLYSLFTIPTVLAGEGTSISLDELRRAVERNCEPTVARYRERFEELTEALMPARESIEEAFGELSDEDSRIIVETGSVTNRDEGITQEFFLELTRFRQQVVLSLNESLSDAHQCASGYRWVEIDNYVRPNGTSYTQRGCLAHVIPSRVATSNSAIEGYLARRPRLRSRLGGQVFWRSATGSLAGYDSPFGTRIEVPQVRSTFTSGPANGGILIGSLERDYRGEFSVRFELFINRRHTPYGYFQIALRDEASRFAFEQWARFTSELPGSPATDRECFPPLQQVGHQDR